MLKNGYNFEIQMQLQFEFILLTYFPCRSKQELRCVWTLWEIYCWGPWLSEW